MHVLYDKKNFLIAQYLNGRKMHPKMRMQVSSESTNNNSKSNQQSYIEFHKSWEKLLKEMG